MVTEISLVNKKDEIVKIIFSIVANRGQPFIDKTIALTSFQFEMALKVDDYW